MHTDSKSVVYAGALLTEKQRTPHRGSIVKASKEIRIGLGTRYKQMHGDVAATKLDEHPKARCDTHPFIPVLVSSRDEKVQRFIQIEVKVTVKMPLNKALDFCFRLLVQVLKFMPSARSASIQMSHFRSN